MEDSSNIFSPLKHISDVYRSRSENGQARKFIWDGIVYRAKTWNIVYFCYNRRKYRGKPDVALFSVDRK